MCFCICFLLLLFTGGSNNRNSLSYTSIGQQSDMGLSRLQSNFIRLHCFLEVLGENTFSCLFQLLDADYVFGSWPLPPL